MKIYSISSALYRSSFNFGSKVTKQGTNHNNTIQNDTVTINNKTSYYTTPDKEGRLPAHIKMGFRELCKMNKELQDKPELLAKIYTATDKHGCVPAHYMNEDKLLAMRYGLEQQPDILEQIYTTQDNEKKLPVHEAPACNLQVMVKDLKDKPDALVKIFTTPDEDGDLPAHLACDVDYIIQMNVALKDKPEVLRQIYTTKNYKGSIPAHYMTSPQIVAMYKGIGYDNELLEQIYLTKNKDGFKVVDTFNSDELIGIKKVIEHKREELRPEVRDMFSMLGEEFIEIPPKKSQLSSKNLSIDDVMPQID